MKKTDKYKTLYAELYKSDIVPILSLMESDILAFDKFSSFLYYSHSDLKCPIKCLIESYNGKISSEEYLTPYMCKESDGTLNIKLHTAGGSVSFNGPIKKKYDAKMLYILIQLHDSIQKCLKQIKDYDSIVETECEKHIETLLDEKSKEELGSI